MSARRLGSFLALAVLMLSGVGIVTWLRIWWTGRARRLERADAIVVFGAAVWPDGPSPTLRTRTQRGAELYRRGLAPVVVCSGGAAGVVPEPLAMAELMRAQGVPDAALVLDDAGVTTRATLASLGALGAGRWRRILAVSSPFHVFRIVEEARRHGIAALPCPARRPPARSVAEKLRLAAFDARQYARETVAVWAYRASSRRPGLRAGEAARGEVAAR
jgi:uncharacterized SAM-binding protein YcdF (DUF218 family)